MPLTNAEVVAAFGDPTPYLRTDGSVDGAWETATLATLTLPAPLPASWDYGHAITRLRVHHKLVGAFSQALATAHANPDAWASLGDTGGCYCWRAQRASLGKVLSRHCWGIAIDLDVIDNPMSRRAGKMHPAVISAFREAGFEWGGAWRVRKDPMHFEFVDVARLAVAA